MTHAHPSYRLGRNPTTTADEELLHLHLRTASYPPSVDNITGIVPGLDGNDRYGDCGPTSVDNHNRVTTRRYGAETDATQDEVFALYRASGNPDFDPATGAGDNGVAMDVMMAALRNVGLGDKKIIAYGKLADTSLASIKTAISLFGAVLFGVNLETAQQTQTQGDGSVWSYSPSGEWGGHAVCAAGYEPQHVEVISWGLRVKCTAGFLSHQLDEVWVPIWPEVAADDRFATLVDTETLAADYQALTGQPWPGSTPTPTPAPTPELTLNITDPELVARITAITAKEGQSPADWITHRLRSYLRM